ncbi:MAG: PEP-CTERM sorting domain-containing protein [Phycisphaeraceae bacterium]
MLLGLALLPANAVLIDDFSGLSTGTIHGQNLWTTIPASTGNVVVNLASGEEELRYSQNSGGALRGFQRTVQNGSILNGATGTLFLNFRANGLNLDSSFGLSDVAAPATAADFEARLTLVNVGGNLTLRATNGGGTSDLTTVSTATNYSLWAVVNNATDTMDVYIQGGAFASQTQVGAGLAFQNGTGSTLGRLFGITTTGVASPSSVNLDNVYLSAGVDLTNPTVLAPNELAKYALVAGTDYSSPATLVAPGLTASAMTTDSSAWANASVGFHTLHTINALAPEGAGTNGSGAGSALDPNAFFTLTLTPDAATTITGMAFTQISGKTGNTGGLNSTVVIRSSMDGFIENLGSFTLSFPGTEPDDTFFSADRFLDLAGLSQFNGINVPVEFRFYLFDNSGASGKVGGFTDLTIFGSAVPEPATIGCLSVGLLALLRRRARTA